MTDSTSDGAQGPLTGLDFDQRVGAANEERVWEGYYDNGGEPVIEREFQFLYEGETTTTTRNGAGKTQDDGATAVKSRSRRANHNDVDAYATLPRRSTRNTSGSRNGRRPPLTTMD